MHVVSSLFQAVDQSSGEQVHRSGAIRSAGWPASYGADNTTTPRGIGLPSSPTTWRVLVAGIEMEVNRPGPDGDFVQATSRSEATVVLL
jgi:hypothetical protein